MDKTEVVTSICYTVNFLSVIVTEKKGIYNMNIILGFVFALAGVLLGFGDNGRGTYSEYISIFAGILWLGGVIAAFWLSGVGFGLVCLAVSFVIAGATFNIGKYLVRKSRRL